MTPADLAALRVIAAEIQALDLDTRPEDDPSEAERLLALALHADRGRIADALQSLVNCKDNAIRAAFEAGQRVGAAVAHRRLARVSETAEMRGRGALDAEARRARAELRARSEDAADAIRQGLSWAIASGERLKQADLAESLEMSEREMRDYMKKHGIRWPWRGRG